MKKTQTGTQAQREGSKRRFHVLPRRRRFPKSCKAKAACMASIIHARLWFFHLFFSRQPCSQRAAWVNKGAAYAMVFIWRTRPLKNRKRRRLWCGSGNEFCDGDTKTRSTPASERLLPKVFPAGQRLTFQNKSANHSFQAPSVTPWRATTLFFPPHLLSSIFVLLQSSGYFLHHLMFIYLFIYFLEFLSI